MRSIKHTSVSWEYTSVLMIILSVCSNPHVTMCISMNSSDLFSSVFLSRRLILFISSQFHLTQWRQFSKCIPSHAMEGSTDGPAAGMGDMAGPVQTTALQICFCFFLHCKPFCGCFLRIGTDHFVENVVCWVAVEHRTGARWTLLERKVIRIFSETSMWHWRTLLNARNRLLEFHSWFFYSSNSTTFILRQIHCAFCCIGKEDIFYVYIFNNLPTLTHVKWIHLKVS